MVYLINAIGFAIIASIWSKTGWVNIAIAMFYTTLAVVNAVGAYPVLSKLITF